MVENKNKWIIGGLAAAVGVGIACYIFSEDGKKASNSSQTHLSREQVLNILRDLKKQMSQAFITLASFAMSIKEQTGNKIPDESIREMLITQSPIQNQLKRAQLKVYQLHKTSQKDFKHAIEVTYTGDVQIQARIIEMKDNLDMAYKGRPPVMNSSLPEFMTQDLTLKVLQDMYDATKYVTFVKIEELKERGIQINPYSEQFTKATQEMESEGEAAKQKVFEKHRLTKSDQPPGILLHNAIQRYTQSNPTFLRKVAMIEEQFKYAMQLIMQGQLPEQEKNRLKRLNDDCLIQELSPGEPPCIQEEENKIEEVV